MTGATVVVVEDDRNIADLVDLYLRQEGFRVVQASTGEQAIEAVRDQRPKMVILDVGLPGGMDGLEVCRRLRATGDVPILMLTARGTEADRIVGLELGADDYVVKPFSPKELVARVGAVFRRTAARQESDEVIRTADVEIDVPRMRVTVGGRPVDLTATEFHLLAALAREPGRVFTRGQLLDAVHGVAFESYERAIDAHIKNLRRKIEPAGGAPRYIRTVYGVGYRFAEA